MCKRVSNFKYQYYIIVYYNIAITMRYGNVIIFYNIVHNKNIIHSVKIINLKHFHIYTKTIKE